MTYNFVSGFYKTFTKSIRTQAWSLVEWPSRQPKGGQMRTMPTLPNKRNRELGAIAIIIAFAWTALFGMAVLAIDFGYLYAKRRGVQSVADAALRGSMPTWVRAIPNGYSGATAKANLSRAPTATSTVRNDNHHDRGRRQPSYTVNVSRTYPTFIGGVFGLSGKTVTGKATGQRKASAGGAAIHANNNAACPGGPIWGIGFQAEGRATLRVNGDVESNRRSTSDRRGDRSPARSSRPAPRDQSSTRQRDHRRTVRSGPWPTADPINVTVAALGAFCMPADDHRQPTWSVSR